MRKVILIAIVFVIICRFQTTAQDNTLIIERLKYVYHLKGNIARQIWESFDDPGYEVPLIYFRDSTSYVANPTGRFLDAFPSKLVYNAGHLEIYETTHRVDAVSFHMETGMTLGTPTKDYNYHSPFMKCSSVETARKVIAGDLSTEEWATMILHEYFHGFQYKHPKYIDYYEDKIVSIQPDSLTRIYKQNS